MWSYNTLQSAEFQLYPKSILKILEDLNKLFYEQDYLTVIKLNVSKNINIKLLNSGGSETRNEFTLI